MLMFQDLGLKSKIMKNDKWSDGFLVGFFIGGIVSITILEFIKKGIL